MNITHQTLHETYVGTGSKLVLEHDVFTSLTLVCGQCE